MMAKHYYVERNSSERWLPEITLNHHRNPVLPKEHVFWKMVAEDHVDSVRPFLTEGRIPVNVGRKQAWTTALAYAAQVGSVRCVRLLVSLGADPNVWDRRSMTAFTRAMNAPAAAARGIADMLLDHPGLDLKGDIGSAALMDAVRNTKVWALQRIVEAGAPRTGPWPTGKGNQERIHSPLNFLCSRRFSQRCYECLCILLSLGLDVNTRCPGSGNTPLLELCSHSSVDRKRMMLLLAYGAHVTVKQYRTGHTAAELVEIYDRELFFGAQAYIKGLECPPPVTAPNHLVWSRRSHRVCPASVQAVALTCLLMRNRVDCVWSWLPRDVAHLIISWSTTGGLCTVSRAISLRRYGPEPHPDLYRKVKHDPTPKQRSPKQRSPERYDGKADVVEEREDEGRCDIV